MKSKIVIGVVLLSAMALAACSSRPAPAAKPAASAQSITVKSSDQMRFEPAALTVQANVPVSLTLDNSGAALVHDFTIDSIGGQKVQVRAQPNAKATVQFTPTAPGSYQFYCAEPGHKEAGMLGTLTVQ
jgi:uncharacterized cupredoxin-like copper-binding protein